MAVDTTTPQGAAMAQVLAVFAELERRLIGQRTRDALAVKKAQGVRLGRPPVLPAEVVARVIAERKAGAGWSTIARGLDADSVPTAQGGARWYPATVRAVALAHRARGRMTRKKGKRDFGTLRVLPSGRVQASWTDPDTGRRETAPRTFETKKAAEAFLASVRTDLGRHEYLSPKAGEIRLRDVRA